ncbi:hypothetical protein PP631_gp100 [Streptomyces phage KimJongPhill]|uniref:Uncharacterized protein n=1 Tax=Streptomyces phage KimJongPhill TaxID=2848886 RepID=A0A8F2E6V5_9CAUD|nr:hypothetical protein PP631_gp100 [Streptomyces phage KimJongPhill]QWT29881.1 hypothetical protein SEA_KIMJONGPHILL_100 [Streptomyces phage KimJongPhill]
MGILDRFRRTADSGDGPGVPEPDLGRPYATVRYKNETGGYTEVQAYSAVQADEIKADHPDAKITPKRGR